MNRTLRDLIWVSRQVGGDPALIQGGGGNTSAKIDRGRKMYVKASGTSLADMAPGKGYRLVDTAACVQMLRDSGLQRMDPHEREGEVLRRLQAACLDNLPGRPSVEASLHALLPGTIVHTHPAVPNGVLCCKNDESLLRKAYAARKGRPPFLYLSYGNPGYPLAVRLMEALERYRAENGRDPEVVFLANHGLFVAKPTAQEALKLTRRIVRDAERLWRGTPKRRSKTVFMEGVEREQAIDLAMATLRALYGEVYGAAPVLRFCDHEHVRDFLSLPSAAAVCRKGPCMPDQFVYAVRFPVLVRAPARLTGLASAIKRRVEPALSRDDGLPAPSCVLIDGLGLFSAGRTLKLMDSAESVTLCSLRAATIAEDLGGYRGLSPSSVRYLAEWEVERFRRSLVESRRQQPPLAGRVAFVTGAGSGLGKGISINLAKAGAHVFLADIDLPAAEETAREIASDGSPKAFPVECNVTSEDSVRRSFSTVVRKLGGLDILVNAAGIAPSHPLEDFPLAHWQMALAVNLTGYFLVAREAARVFIRQGGGGSIVNLSSKTGLQASKSNSVYNATKAGEIHLARGWALELAEHGVRVNAVAPGNVFSGSKIWNPDYIKACAAKRGIKPEEVIPYYVALTPLKKEITWEDVGNAVVFLCSDAASKITGQVLVVDGGQVMVR